MSLLAQDRTYRRWKAMRQRVLNPNNTAFDHYGGRGITICSQWDKFAVFLADMGECPPGLTLERKNNNGPYAPENCRWATRKEQRANQRQYSNALMVEHNGRTMTLAQLARDSGVNYQTLVSRYRTGRQLV